MALEDGGEPWDLSNLQALCRACHFAKTGREIRARRPVPPSVVKWQVLVAELD